MIKRLSTFHFSKKKIAGLLLLFIVIGVAITVLRASKSESDSILYKDGMIDLGLAFTANGFCSCLFVSEQSEESCRDYAALKQVSPRLSVDLINKTTTSSLFFFWSKSAKYLGSELGCQVQ